MTATVFYSHWSGERWDIHGDRPELPAVHPGLSWELYDSAERYHSGRVLVVVRNPTRELLADPRFPSSRNPSAPIGLADYRHALRTAHERLCAATALPVKVGKVVHQLPASWDYQSYLAKLALDVWSGAEKVSVWVGDSSRTVTPATFKLLFKTYRAKLRNAAGLDLVQLAARIDAARSVDDCHAIRFEGAA